jgi:hypothetical protein
MSVHRIALTVVVLLALLGSSPTAVPELSNWSAPVNLGPVVNSTFNDLGPAISKNGLSLYFQSNRPGGIGAADIWVSQRTDVAAEWRLPTNLGPTINTPFTEGGPTFSRDGHWMFFNSDRPGGIGGTDIWASWRAQTHDDFGWEQPVNLGPVVNSASGDAVGSYFENEEAGSPLLFLSSNRPATGFAPGGPFVSAQGADGSFGPALPVIELDSPVDDMRPMIRFDGLEILLLSNRLPSIGLRDLWVSVRKTVFDTWAPPVNFGPVVNSASNELTPYLSSDGRQLFFASDRPGGSGGVEMYVTTREKPKGK